MFTGFTPSSVTYSPAGKLHTIGPVNLKPNLNDLSITFSATKKDLVILLYVVECIYEHLYLARYEYYRDYYKGNPFNTVQKPFSKTTNNSIKQFLPAVNLNRVPQVTLNGRPYYPGLQSNLIKTLNSQNTQNCVNLVKLKVDLLDIEILKTTLFGETSHDWYG